MPRGAKMSKMQISDALEVVKLHNQWRRGAEISMQDPKVLGEALDAIVEFCEKCIKTKQYEI